MWKIFVILAISLIGTANVYAENVPSEGTTTSKPIAEKSVFDSKKFKEMRSKNCAQHTKGWRLARLFVATAMGLKDGRENQRDRLWREIEEYDKNEKELSRYFSQLIEKEQPGKGDAIKKDVDRKWLFMKAALEKALNPKHDITDEEILEVLHTTKNYIKSLKPFSSLEHDTELLNMAKTMGFICKTPQKMTAYYLAMLHGVFDDPEMWSEYESEMEKSIKDVYAKINKVIKYTSGLGLKDISKEMKKVKRELVFFKMMWKNRNGIPVLVSRKSDEIFKNTKAAKKKMFQLVQNIEK